MKTHETKSLKELSEIWMAMERKTFEQRKKRTNTMRSI